jgi:hypothetical protein
MVLALFSATANGLGEMTYTIDKEFDTVTPIFMDGHNGDMQWVEGFNVSGRIYLDGNLVGTVTGEVRLWNPPMSMTEVYDQASMRINNSIDGLGAFDVYAQGVSMSSSTFATAGDVLLSWSGSIANGTGSFQGSYGLSVGIGSANIFSGAATIKEIISMRANF